MLLGCSTAPVKTQYVKVYPPTELVQLCEHTKLEGKTVRDLVVAKVRADDKVADCNLRQKKLIDYLTKKGDSQ